MDSCRLCVHSSVTIWSVHAVDLWAQVSHDTRRKPRVRLYKSSSDNRTVKWWWKRNGETLAPWCEAMSPASNWLEHFFLPSLSRACLLSCSRKQRSHHSLRLMSCLCWCNLPRFVPARMKNSTAAMKNSCVLALNYVHIFARQTLVIASVWTSAFI